MNDITISLEDRIKKTIKEIYDPEIPVNIYDLGLIYSIVVDETNAEVKIKMTLTSPACPVALTLPQSVKDAVAKVDGIASVLLELVWDPPWDESRMSEVAKLQLNLH